MVIEWIIDGDQTLNSTCPPYLKFCVAPAMSLTCNPTDVLAMSLKRREGNLRRRERLAFVLILVLKVRFCSGKVRSTAKRASWKIFPFVLRMA
jgi:hypothetical protein